MISPADTLAKKGQGKSVCQIVQLPVGEFKLLIHHRRTGGVLLRCPVKELTQGDIFQQHTQASF